MLRIFIVLGLSWLAFSAHAAGKLQVFTCEPEWAALVNELAGDRTAIYQATTALQDPHHIEARPSLIAKMRKADLLVCSGAGLEAGWLPLVIRQSANRNILPGQPGHFEAAMQVSRLDVPERVDRSLGDVHAQGNPHVHLDPRRVLQIAAALRDRLMMIDAGNSQYYQQRYTAFETAWRDAIKQWEAIAKPLRGVNVVVHHRDSVYLFDWLGMNIVVSLEPKPGIAPAAGYLGEVKQHLKQQPADLVVYAAYQHSRAARWISREMNIPLVKLPYTVGATPTATSLKGLFDDTLSHLLAALGQSS